MNNKNLFKQSKFLSLVLRHKPESIGLTLDENGWADTAELLTKCIKNGQSIDLSTLQQIVSTNEKQRFAFNEDYTKIRANQGHSIAIDLKLEHKTPPDILYHGTVEKFIESIKATGLKKMNRQHVHLSKDMDTAIIVAKRRGTPIILSIDAAKMNLDGLHFYQSENGVWLTNEVPLKYINF